MVGECKLFFSACDDSSSTAIGAFGESSSSETILSSSVESSSSLIQSSSSADVITLNSGTENFAAQWAYFDSLFTQSQNELCQIDVVASNFGSCCNGSRYRNAFACVVE
jgi:hypothetical protein